MKRRESITLLGGAAAACPLSARAQSAPALPIIGWLGATSAESWRDRIADTREGLKEQGFVERQNVIIEYRWADDRYERIPQLAADLVRQRVNLIISGGGTAT